MSPFFVKKFRGIYTCKACDEEKVSSRKLCPKHLAAARDKWRTWAFDRRCIGKCVACDRNGRKATRWHHSRTMDDREQRCAVHAAVNVKRCRRFSRRNPERSRRDWEKRKQYTARGLCLKCPEHRKLVGDEKRCEPCRVASRLGHGVEWSRALARAAA